jgi:hypothetical protein
MFENPIIRRYRFSQLRSQQTWVFGSLYFCIAMLVIILNTTLYRYGENVYRTQAELFRSLFIQFGLMELFMLWLAMPACTSSVVTREMVDKSFDFFRMLPLSASQKAVGILVGRNQLCLLVAAINLVPCLVLAAMSDLSAGLVCQLAVLTLAAAVLFNLLALLFSIISFRKNRSASPILLIVVGFYAMSPVLGIFLDSDARDNVGTYTAYFFALEVPLLYLIAFIAMCMSAWAYVGILRRFSREYESVFSRLGTRLFVLTCITLIYGLFYMYMGLEQSNTPYAYVYWVVSLLPVWVVPACSLYNFDKYLEISRSSRADHLFRRLLANSNMVAGLPLFAIWLVFAVVACVSSHASALALLSLATLNFSSFLVILALLETYVTWKPRNEKLGYLVGFAAVVYFILPLILSEIFARKEFLMFSPIGALRLLDPQYAMVMQSWPILVNLLLLALLGMLIRKRYNDLVLTRRTMDSLPKAA